MKFTQKNGVSIITMDTPLTSRSSAELSDLFPYISRNEPHRVVLDMKRVPYVNSAGLKALFAQYSLLYNKQFSLEIQHASADVVEILKLANFHLISIINPKNINEKAAIVSLS